METNFVKHTAAAFAALTLFSTALPITAFAAEPANDCIDENETAPSGFFKNRADFLTVGGYIFIIVPFA